MAESIDYRSVQPMEEVENISGKEKAPAQSSVKSHNSVCMIVLGMAGSGKTTFVQVCRAIIK